MFVFAFLAPAASAQVVEEDPAEMRGVTIEDRLGESIPAGLTFTDHDGNAVTLDTYFNKSKPVVVTLVYYNCPMLCTLVLNGLTDAMRNTGLKPGEDFTIVTVSIDDRETPELSQNKRHRYEQAYGSSIDGGWYFHTGDQENIAKLADALGFRYYYDERIDQFVHPAGVFLLTEEGTISRVLYGISFPPRDLKLGLLEASEGKIGSAVDKLILYCFHYDPDAKGYVVFAGNVMKLGGLITLLVMGVFLTLLWRRDRNRRTTAAA